MAEGSSPAPTAALAAWLASPEDPSRIAALAAVSRGGAVPAATIERLPIAALRALAAPGEPIRFTGLRPGVRAALIGCGAAQRCGLQPTADEAAELESRPFALRLAGDEILVEISTPGRGGTAAFATNTSHDRWVAWGAGVQAAALVVECGRLDHINSMVIAWLLRLGQHARPVPIRIRGAKPQVATQLRQLRLDHLMAIE